MNSTFYARYGRVIIAAFVVMLPVVLYAAAMAALNNTNDVRTWLPQNYDESRDYAWFKEQFGLEEFVLVTWPGCVIDSPQLEDFAKRSLPAAGSPGYDERHRLFSRVITGTRVINTLMEEPAELTRAQAIRRLKRALVGADGKQTCAILTPTDFGKEKLHRMLAVVYEIGAECQIPREEIRLGGPPVVNAAIDTEGARSLSRLAGLSGLVALGVSWWCFRSVRLTFLVFATGLFCAALSLAVVRFTGNSMNAILLMMPPLVYVAVMSGAIHLTNYYLEALPEAGPKLAPWRAVAHAWLPLALAASTTAVGLLSLCYSELLPIRQFGTFSAIGVVLGTFTLLLFLPSAFQIFPASGHDVATLDDHVHHDDGLLRLSPRWTAFAGFVVKRANWITAGLLAVLVGCGFGLQRLETTIKVEKFFSPRSKILQDYDWMQSKLGGLVPMEVVIRVPKNDKLSVLDQLQLVSKVQQRIEELPVVSSTQSAATFAPPLTTKRVAYRTVLMKRLEKALPAFEKSKYYRDAADEHLWRVSIRIPTTTDIDYTAFIANVREEVTPLVEAQRTAGAAGVSAVFTGMVPVFNKAQQSLLDGMLFGFATDLLLIVIAVVVLMRHWSAGAIIVCTSLFPTTVVFGVMSWLGIKVDVGSVMTPSIALGVTVDDVVHFLLWFRRGIAMKMSRGQAVMLAYQGCARPMYQSWGVIGLGLLVFALSTFVPALRFGLLMIALLTVGLVGNLLLMPALLAGPLGGFFARHAARGHAKLDDLEKLSDDAVAEMASDVG